MITEKEITLSMGVSAPVTALMSLASVVSGVLVPAELNLFMTGEFSCVDNSAFSDMINAFIGVRNPKARIRVYRTGRPPVRELRDRMLHECNTPYLWMLDDDVIPRSDCLHELVAAIGRLDASDADWGWLNGVKVDATNRRGYKDYTLQRLKEDVISTSAPCLPWKNKDEKFSPNHLYASSAYSNALLPLARADAGNAVINVSRLRANSKLPSFYLDGDDKNAGGEDELFIQRLQIEHKLRIVLAPMAEAIHLPKSSPMFNEFVNRAELERLQVKILKEKVV